MVNIRWQCKVGTPVTEQPHETVARYGGITGRSGSDIVTVLGTVDVSNDDTMHHVPAVACQVDSVESGMGD